MCRAPSSPLLPVLLLLLAAPAQVHAQSLPADIELLPDSGGGGASPIPVKYDGFQVLRVHAVKNSTIQLLKNFEDDPGFQLWSEKVELGGTVDVMVSPEVRDQLTEQLTEAGADFAINIDNVQTVIEGGSPATANLRLQVRQSLQYGHPLTWENYHRLADHHQFLEYMAYKYHESCSSFSIGYSTEQRDIKGIKCGSGKREIWMDGGIHAREWISPAVVSYLVREFSERSDSVQDIVNEFTLYFVPVLNPDGYEYSHTNDRMWRKTRSRTADSNCVGVDANRNFDVSWGESGTSKRPCDVTYGGPYAFSEPESRAVRDFVLSHKDKLEMFITFHSFSELLFVPYAFTVKKPDDYDEVRRVAEQGVAAIYATSGRNFTIPQTTKHNKLSGVSDDWAKAVAGINYTYTFELRDRGRHGFLLPPAEIEPSGREIAAAVKAMIRALLKRQPSSAKQQAAGSARQYGAGPARQNRASSARPHRTGY